MRLPGLCAVFSAVLWLTASLGHAQPANPRPHNVILFVADGLRADIVTPQTAPTMARVRREGVDFRNSHSVYPTLTTANASALATGHQLGDTGDFANSILVGHGLPSAHNQPIVMLENDAILADLDRLYPEGYLNETTVLAAARAAGYSTASIGKLGPVAIQDVTDRSGRTIVIDDDTGQPDGVPLSPDVAQAIASAGLQPRPPGRGENGRAGDAAHPGTHEANVAQERWFGEVAAKVLLPRFKAAGRPFVMVYWSRDPDGSQHNQGDSPGRVVPGINGPTSLAAIRNADDNLARLLEALRAQGLDMTTDVVVTADHGFSTISKQSRTSPSAKLSYPDVLTGEIPPGFLGIDLALALGRPLFDASGAPVDFRHGQHPKYGNAYIGDPQRPEVIVASNGGSDLLYLPGPDAPALIRRILAALWRQDYTGAVFVNDRYGRFPGALPMSAINLIGSAATPQPAMVVGFRSFSTGCANPEICAAEVADTSNQQGQGMHGSPSRADTHNFMAAIGPDFKTGFTDPAPSSNADLGRTMMRLLQLDPSQKGGLRGRVLSEALKGGAPVKVSRWTLRASPTADGLATIANMQSVGTVRYLDVAGLPGREVGLTP